MLGAGFTFLQVDSRAAEGRKLISFYQLLDSNITAALQEDRLPATLLLDPITGARMGVRRGRPPPAKPETMNPEP